MFLKQLRLINFRRFKDETITFSHTTNIYGKNAAGKSSIVDAYHWLMFGKNAEDKECIRIKPEDANGKTNPDVVTEVSGIFEIDGGVTIEFKRSLEENWVAPKGELNKVFKGNICKRYINGIEVGVDEYENKITGLTAPPVIVGAGKKARAISPLKLISNIKYFNEILHWSDRKQVLFAIAPPISDSDIVAANPELRDIGPALAMGIDTYAAQEGPKLKELQKQLDALPARIEENIRSRPEALNYTEIERKLAAKEAEFAACEKKLFDISMLYNDYMRDQQEIFSIENKIRAIETERERTVRRLSDGRAGNIESLRRRVEQAREYAASSSMLIEHAKKKLAEMTSDLDDRRAARARLKAETFTPPDPGNFICPTCRRPLDADDIDQKIEEMRRNFNTDHANKMTRDSEDGLALREKINNQERLIAELASKAVADKKAYDNLAADLQKAESTELKPPAFDDTERSALLSRLADMKAALSEPQTDRDAVTAQKQAITTEIDELKALLYTRTQIEAANKRIEELKSQEKAAAAKKAEIERMLYLCELFSKIKVSMLEDNLSGMFAHTKIKLIEVNEKGVEDECCTATLDGIVYPVVNTAGQAFVDLDIINTLSKAFGFEAPVFFDRRESVDELPPSDLQTINLFAKKGYKKLVAVNAEEVNVKEVNVKEANKLGVA